ncbi:hypothetical protein M3Y99_00498900 [Aphelenchoides fujianensis]|nr:hypothetical protein M3Y99_00498900 [Aphelenchoides fujianensis]
MSTVVGLAACAVSSLFFGSMFVPIKRCKPGDGIFVQFIMCSSIFTVGLFVYLMRQLPQFQPFAMIGGAAWCIGNLTAVPVIRNIGLGLGVLIWGVVNCTVGWAIGRFGCLGRKPPNPIATVAETSARRERKKKGRVGASRPVPVVTTHAEVHAPAPILEAVSTREVVDGAEQQPSGEIEVVDGERAGLVHPSPALPNAHEQPADGAAKKQKLIGILLSLVAGICYGITFTPVIYIQDNPEKFFHPPKDAIDYVFSHYCGIYLTSISVLIVYVAFKRNRPFVDPQIIGPSLLAGVLWSIAQIAWFVANDSLSQAITFPINSMVPGVIATLWSVLYFKEITGRRNLQFLTVAVVITLFGAALVGLSKSL